ERNVLPCLNITGAPVVEQHQAEDVIERATDGNGLSHLVARSHERGDLQLKVERSARPKERNVSLLRFALAARASNRRSAHDDAPGPAMTGDRQVQLVRHQGVVRSA